MSALNHALRSILHQVTACAIMPAAFAHMHLHPNEANTLSASRQIPADHAARCQPQEPVDSVHTQPEMSLAADQTQHPVYHCALHFCASCSHLAANRLHVWSH